MIEKMTKYSFVLLSEETEGFLQEIQKLGLVDVTRSLKDIDENSSVMVDKIAANSKAVSILEKVDYSEDPMAEEIAKAAGSAAPSTKPLEDLARIQSTLDTLQKDYDSELRQIALRAPWGDFNSETIDALEQNGLKIRFYSVPTKNFEAGWVQRYPLQVISDDGKQTRFVTVTKEDDEYSFPVEECAAPGGSYLDSEADAKALSERIVAVKGDLVKLKDSIPALKAETAKTVDQLDLYRAGKGTEKAVEGYVTVITGFAPVEKDEELEKSFEQLGVYYAKEEAVVDDNPPISLKNNWYTKMFSVMTDMYGRPEYNGFDPTPYISIFFLLFFAFCMGDAGYGLVLVLLGLGMKKIKSFSDLAPLVSVLGLGTIVIGLFFHTFFSVDMLTWNCIPEGVKKCMLPSKIMGYDGTMVLAILVGIFHLCVAFIVKTIYATKQKGFLNSLGVWGWTLLIVGGVILAGVGLTGVLDKSVTKILVIVLGVVSALGIFIFNDIHRNPLVNIGSGLWETYNTATGLLGDVLSYLRLYALGLAGAMLGQAFNTLGTMALGEGSAMNWVFFIIIVMIGHVLNMAMAALGAFVHPLRLNFLEFFKNSGYEISGRDYTPLSNQDK
ncbi:MAG: hypothetical protein MJZ16_05790 [Bacteroidales bacterium]|nr:hypothetical protein [Bacteroidales bacterium]